MTVSQVSLPHLFRPRIYQYNLLAALDSGTKRACAVWARRHGKDVTVLNWVIKSLYQEKKTCFYCLPTFSQARRVIWDSINNDGMKILDYFPAEIVEAKNVAEMKITLTNGSVFQLIGSDQYDRLVGTNPKIVVFSEAALSNPKAWEYIKPILTVNDGVAIFISTPRGKNWFFDLYQMASRSEDWFCEKLTNADTGLVPRGEIEKLRAEGMSDELVQQEFYCDFSRGVDGTYYGRLLSKAWDDDRICSVPYDSSLDVNTSWDLGIGDATAIWFWQQTPGGEIHFIDYYENAGESLSHYVALLRERDYLYDRHFFPHDTKARELGSGATREEMLRKLGIKPSIVPKLAVDDGIQAVRSILPRCWFDKGRCAVGIKHLENYRKVFSDKLKCYVDRPLHDSASDCADSMRYAAISISKGRRSGMTEQDADNLSARYAYNI